MLNPQQRWFLIKLIPYPIISLSGGFLYWILELGIIGETKFYPATGNLYNSSSSFVAVHSMTFLLGLSLGLIEETLFKGRFRKISFLPKIILKTVIYMGLLTLLMFVSSIILNAINMNTSVTDPEVISTVVSFLGSFTYMSIAIYAGAVIDLTLFFNEIISFLGLDVVGTYFTGKYSKPVKESRVFMFLDMRSSTTIAEKLGHEKHYQLINDYYADMSRAIIETQGQVYQYVGDEIVVSWKIDRGLNQSNCLACFFQISEKIRQKSERYIFRYGLIATFKAGLHVGEVTRGQVGLIKREMLFIGDVLNTTARIQGLCNELESDLLISKELKARLPETLNFNFASKGCYELRGREQKEELFEVTVDN
ncbi:MAG: adenylate/guanylate cyclase domain-containing protein [Cytophagales bacterium]|nr:adenylate/guanylate cyclase domain-containing protein [Cytophagales bacterium]